MKNLILFLVIIVLLITLEVYKLIRDSGKRKVFDTSLSIRGLETNNMVYKI